MAADFEELSLPGVVLCRARKFADARGFFVERFHEREYRSGGVGADFVQLNHSYSRRDVLRGMHYQVRNAQAKLVTVLVGRVFDVVVDARRGSSTFGKWLGLELDAGRCEQLFIPAGYAHGFCVLSEEAHFLYHCSAFYDPADEAGFHWSSAGIEWPVTDPILSDKDRNLPAFGAIPEDKLPI